MLAGVALGVAGCASGGMDLLGSGTTAPAYRDALSGLYPTPASVIPNDIPVNYRRESGGAMPDRAAMALVPGGNFGRLRAYHDSLTKGSLPGLGAGVTQDLDIQPVLRRAIEILKAQYPNLELMDDIATAQQHDAPLTLVLDIRSYLGHGLGDSAMTRVAVDVVVFDRFAKPIAHIAVEGRAAVTLLNGYAFQDAAADALRQFEPQAKTILT